MYVFLHFSEEPWKQIKAKDDGSAEQNIFQAKHSYLIFRASVYKNKDASFILLKNIYIWESMLNKLGEPKGSCDRCHQQVREAWADKVEW